MFFQVHFTHLVSDELATKNKKETKKGLRVWIETSNTRVITTFFFLKHGVITTS